MSDAVNWEIDEAHRQEKQVIGILLHRDIDLEIPPAMDVYDEVIYVWLSGTSLGRMRIAGICRRRVTLKMTTDN